MLISHLLRHKVNAKLALPTKLNHTYIEPQIWITFFIIVFHNIILFSKFNLLHYLLHLWVIDSQRMIIVTSIYVRTYDSRERSFSTSAPFYCKICLYQVLLNLSLELEDNIVNSSIFFKFALAGHSLKWVILKVADLLKLPPRV